MTIINRLSAADLDGAIMMPTKHEILPGATRTSAPVPISLSPPSRYYIFENFRRGALQRFTAALLCSMPPFTAHRRDGKLILEIDESRFLTDAVGDPDANLRLVDREQFLRFALANIFSLTHDLKGDDRATWWRRLSESLGKAAAATAHGVRQDQVPAPTCGCDPEVHDGG